MEPRYPPAPPAGGDGTPVFASPTGGVFANGAVRLVQYAPGYGSMNAQQSYDMGQVVSPMAGSDGFFTSYTAGTGNPPTSGSGAYATGVCSNLVQRQATVSVGCALHLQAGSNSSQGWTSNATQGSSGAFYSTAQLCMANVYFATPAACVGASACVGAADAGGNGWGVCFPTGAVTQAPAGAACSGVAGGGGMQGQSCSQVNLFGFLKPIAPGFYAILNGNNKRAGSLTLACNAANTSIAATTASTSGAYGTWAYVGCFADQANYGSGAQRAIPNAYGNAQGYTAASCATWATSQGYNIFSLQYGGTCWGCAGCNFAAQGLSTACPAYPACDASGSCGGANANAVFVRNGVALTLSVAAGAPCPPSSLASPAYAGFVNTNLLSLSIPAGAPSSSALGSTMTLTLPNGPVISSSGTVYSRSLTFDAAANTYYGFDGTFFVAQFGFARTTVSMVCSTSPSLSVVTATESPQFTYNLVVAGAPACGGWQGCPAGTYQSGGTGNASCAPCTGTPAPGQYFSSACPAGSTAMTAVLSTCTAVCPPGYTLSLPCVAGSLSLVGSPGVCTLAAFGPLAWYDPGSLVPSGAASPAGSNALWQPNGATSPAVWASRAGPGLATVTGTLTLGTDAGPTTAMFSATPVSGLGITGSVTYVQGAAAAPPRPAHPGPGPPTFRPPRPRAGSNSATVTFPETVPSNTSICTVSRYLLPVTGTSSRVFAGTSNFVHGKLDPGGYCPLSAVRCLRSLSPACAHARAARRGAVCNARCGPCGRALRHNRRRGLLRQLGS